MSTYQTKITPNGKTIDVVVGYDHQPAEPISQDREYGGCDAYVLVESVFDGSINITDYLHDSILDDLEKEILKFIQNY